MLSAIPQQYHLFFGIGGLVLLLLFITGFAQRYQAYQLEKEAALRRLLNGVQQVEAILALIEGSAVPGKLFVLLRKEVLARYMAIRQIYKRLENLGSLIDRAQQGVVSAESRPATGLTKPADRQTFNKYMNGLTELIGFLHSQGHIAGMTETDRRQFQHALLILRADYVSLFHSEESITLARKQMWNEASRHLKEALVFFQNHAAADPHISELYSKINMYNRQVLNKQVPGSAPVAEPEETAVQSAGTNQ